MKSVLGVVAVLAWLLLVSATLIMGGLDDIARDSATLGWPSTPGMVVYGNRHGG